MQGDASRCKRMQAEGRTRLQAALLHDALHDVGRERGVGGKHVRVPAVHTGGLKQRDESARGSTKGRVSAWKPKGARWPKERGGQRSGAGQRSEEGGVCGHVGSVHMVARAGRP